LSEEAGTGTDLGGVFMNRGSRERERKGKEKRERKGGDTKVGRGKPTEWWQKMAKIDEKNHVFAENEKDLFENREDYGRKGEMETSGFDV